MTSPSRNITATAVAVLSEAGAIRTFLARHIAKLSNANAEGGHKGQVRQGLEPRNANVAEVVTVNVSVSRSIGRRHRRRNEGAVIR